VCAESGLQNECTEKFMTNKEQFLAFVFFGALAEDLRSDTANAQLIARLATDIPDDKIPHCPANAAKVFLAYCGGRTERPFKWMLGRGRAGPNDD
jgi:hypothetical protein